MSRRSTSRSTFATILTEEFRDTEDLDGVFSGLDREERHYDVSTWGYEGM